MNRIEIGNADVWMEVSALSDILTSNKTMINMNVFLKDPATTSYPYRRAVKVRVQFAEIKTYADTLLEDEKFKKSFTIEYDNLVEELNPSRRQDAKKEISDQG